MADTFVSIAPDPPEPFIVRKISSAAGSVADLVKREFLPTAQTDYSPTTNQELEFFISSPDSFLAGKGKTFLRFNLRVQSSNDSFADDKWVELEEGGAYNLFRRVEVRDAAGTDICTYSDFDLMMAMRNAVGESPDHINHHAWRRGDSAETYDEELVWTPITGTHTILAATPNIVDGVGSTYTTELAEGDRIKIINATSNVLLTYTNVTQVISNTQFTIPALGRTNDVTAFILVGRSMRNAVCKNNNNTLTNAGTDLNMPIDFSIFGGAADFPLMFTQGLRVRFFLKEARFAFNTGAQTGVPANKVLDYQISTPRIIAYLRTPDAAVMSTYMQAHANGSLAYTFPMYHHLQRQVNGSESSEMQLDLPIAKSSVNYCMFVIQNVRTRGATNSTNPLTDVYTYPNKTFIDGKVKNYQFRVGGKDYPQQRVDIKDPQMIEVFTEYLNSMQIHDAMLTVPRHPSSKWTKTNQSSSALTDFDESHKVVFTTSFAHLDRDRFAGIRTRGPGTDQHVILTAEFTGEHLVDGSPSPRYVDVFFQYNRIMQLMPGSGIIILD